ncbi:hypothetical protein [Nocardia sp. NPDC051463]|uniref:hypothetical protein n=1 Tax=Nocardia sp. NPDC051463 TaxID=3154845 RepID=UPI003442ED58
MVWASEYDKAMPLVAEHLAKIDKAVGRTRSTRAGGPFPVVRHALAEALAEEGCGHVESQVVDEYARQIAEDPANSRD